jgi:DNA mismatch repair protein MutH
MIMENNGYLVEYDKSDPTSIEIYSQKLIGKTFRQIWEEDDARQPMMVREDSSTYGSSEVTETKRNKGNLGQIIEEKFFHYECNSDSRADFHEAGVELKVTPYRINQNGSLSAKERLILTMIDYFQVVNETFEESHFWNKSKLILLVYYLYMKEIKYNLDYKIGYSRLFTPPAQDVKIIRHDYYIIVSKIKEGKAHELSEGDTLYLGAAPKAATSKDRRKQPFSNELAKPRAFAFKNSYMTYVLNNYIVPGKVTYEPIIQDETVDSFEDYVVGKINSYRGYSVDDLCAEFAIEGKKRPKNLEALLTYRILGIKGNHAEEFEKASIAIKTIRIGKNDRIKESMSFPTFQFKELIEEEWEDSTFGNYLRETRFLFVVYKFDQDDVLRLRGCQFWNIPYEDLESDVREVWSRTQMVIRDGLQIKIINGKRTNNLPKVSENPVCHVRPHAKNALDTYELPDGRQYPKQCFWLNNTYIYNQIDEEIKG